MKIVAVIPARYDSTRFRGKPLAKIHGRPMVQWVYEAAAGCDLIDQVLIATDHAEIARAVRGFGGNACMTSRAHVSGTDRVAEVAGDLDVQIIVNIQGDEPLITPEAIRQALQPLFADKTIAMGTLKTRIASPQEMQDHNIVKVVTDANDFALYFSRSPIPFMMDKDNATVGFRHIGLYVYRKDFLLKFSQLPPSTLEKTESLEQLRALEYGYAIKVASTSYSPVGVDTPEDLSFVENLLRGKK